VRSEISSNKEGRPEAAVVTSRALTGLAKLNQMKLLKKSSLNVALAAALIYAIYLPAALWLRHSYVPLAAPPGAYPLQQQQIFPVEGFAFRSPIDVFIPLEDDKADDQHSPVILYEDDKPLGPAHSPHGDIEHIGQGRYSHWKGIGMMFSTSDNSDPTTNGRHYWVVCRTATPLVSTLRCAP
jgi:hypothetical protein